MDTVAIDINMAVWFGISLFFKFNNAEWEIEPSTFKMIIGAFMYYGLVRQMFFSNITFAMSIRFYFFSFLSSTTCGVEIRIFSILVDDMFQLVELCSLGNSAMLSWSNHI